MVEMFLDSQYTHVAQGAEILPLIGPREKLMFLLLYSYGFSANQYTLISCDNFTTIASYFSINLMDIACELTKKCFKIDQKCHNCAL